MDFDENGDPNSEYNIVTWVWRKAVWTLRVVGSFQGDSLRLTVDDTQIEWHNAEESESVRILWRIISNIKPMSLKSTLFVLHVCSGQRLHI